MLRLITTKLKTKEPVLQQSLDRLNGEIRTIVQELAPLKSSLDYATSFVHWLKTVLGKDDPIDRELLQSKIRQLEERKRDLERQRWNNESENEHGKAEIRQTLLDLLKRRSKLSRIFDYWPDYPPDWEIRCERIKSRLGFCTSRDGQHGGQLHVHHIVPISLGGSNRLDNLTVLCERHHSQAHPGGIWHGRRHAEYEDAGEEADDSWESQATIPRVSEKVVLIRSAIDAQKGLQMRYRDAFGITTDRLVEPRRLYRGFHKRIYCEGYCHLRQADRVFRVSRILELRRTE